MSNLKLKHPIYAICPKCGGELVKNHNMVYHGNDGVMHFICNCGCKSKWTFYGDKLDFIGEENE